MVELHLTQIFSLSIVPIPWDALVGHSMHVFDVLLSYAMLPSVAPHGSIHTPLRLMYGAVQLVGVVHGSPLISPHALVVWTYVHVPPLASCTVMVSDVSHLDAST